MQKTELEQKKAKFVAEMKALKDEKGAKYEFLESVADSLKKVIKIANFKQIQKGLKDNFQQDISVSTIKRFCVDKGFYKPKVINKKPKVNEIPAPNDKPKVENTTNFTAQNMQNDKPKEQLSSINDSATASNADKGIIGKFFDRK